MQITRPQRTVTIKRLAISSITLATAVGMWRQCSLHGRVVEAVSAQSALRGGERLHAKTGQTLLHLSLSRQQTDQPDLDSGGVREAIEQIEHPAALGIEWSMRCEMVSQRLLHAVVGG